MEEGQESRSLSLRMSKVEIVIKRRLRRMVEGMCGEKEKNRDKKRTEWREA